MKKLMIVAAVALCTICANAAAFSWKTTASLTTDGSAVATSSTAMNGGTFALVYLGNNADKIDWTTASVVDTASPSFVSSMGKTTAKTSKTFTFSMDDYGNGDIFGVVFKDSSDKLYYLQTGASGNMSPTYTISGLTDPTSTLDSFDFASSAFSISTAPSAAVAAVPEPTSAMLLLLGMAGLALRRKRA
jgi:hypothetical protein